jgi:hypothetical protein
MQSGDRQEFDTQMAMLCAGFNVPQGDRFDAYWKGLEKMQLASFVRVVEHALGENGPDKIPTTQACWAISKQLRARPTVYVHQEAPNTHWNGDAWDQEANHHMLRYYSQKLFPRAVKGRYGTTHYMGGLPLRIDESTRIRTGYLLEAKNAWAQEMREGGDAERDPAYQMRLWNELFQIAEKRIDQHIAQQEAA